MAARGGRRRWLLLSTALTTAALFGGAGVALGDDISVTATGGTITTAGPGGVNVTSGNAAGIQIVTLSGGVIDNTSTVGNNRDGISADTSPGIGDLTIVLGDAVSGTRNGVNAASGSGNVEISGNGTNTITGSKGIIIGNGGSGILAGTYGGGGDVSIHGNGDIGADIGGQGHGIFAVSGADINGNAASYTAGGDISLQDNGNITGRGNSQDGIHADARGTTTGGSINIGDITANGAVSGGQDGMDLATSGPGTITVVVADDVTGNKGAGIKTSSVDSVSIENSGGSTVTIQGKTGAGIAVITTSDGVTGNHNGDTVHIFGSSGTTIGSTDGMNTQTGGAPITVEDWDRIEGQAERRARPQQRRAGGRRRRHRRR